MFAMFRLLLIYGSIITLFACLVFIIFEKKYYTKTTLKYEAEKKNLEGIAYVDVLTNCINRRAMDNILSQRFNDFKSYNTPYTIVMVDIDNFKKVNDLYGHEMGDIVLKSVAKIMTSIVRSQDYVCRWGGEEFLILLNSTALASCCDVAERIRVGIEQSSVFIGEHTVKVTVSMGLSEVQVDDDSEQLAITRADKAMYISKSSGKNKVIAG